MADKMLKIELKKSLIGRGAKQIATAEALGLKKPGDVTVQPDNARSRETDRSSVLRGAFI